MDPGHQQFVDFTIRLTDGAMIAIVSFGVKVLMGLRDAVQKLTIVSGATREDVDDHEDRLRVIEGKPMRRRSDGHQH